MRVTHVNSKEWTVNLVGDGPGTTSCQGVPWDVPYRHPDGGGIDFCPEVGATCHVLWHPEDSFPVILGFTSPYHRQLNFGSGRRALNPGDVILWSRDDNRIIMRRGGNIEIVSTAECRRTYIAANHTISEVCRDLKTTTRGGSLTWITEDQALNAKSGSRSVYRLGAKRYAQDAEDSVELLFGGIQANSKGFSNNGSLLMSWRVGPTDDPLYRVTVDENGNSEIVFKGDVRQRVSGSRSTVISGDESLKASSVSMEATSGNFAIVSRSGSYRVTASSSTEVISGMKRIQASSVVLGKVGGNPAVLGRELFSWLASHVHPAPGVPAVSVATLPSILSKTVFLE